MALKTRHWVLATALCCATIAAAYLPPNSPFPRFFWSEYGFSSETAWAWRISNLTKLQVTGARLLEQRDVALDASQKTANGLWIYIEPEIPAVLDSAIRAEMSTLEDSLFSSPDSLRTALAFFLETTDEWEGFRIQGLRSMQDIHYLLPHTTDGRTCVSVISLAKGTGDAALDSTRTRPVSSPVPAIDALGPCGLTNLLGAPSPSLSDWMRLGGIETREPTIRHRCRNGELEACREMFHRPPTLATQVGAGTFSLWGRRLQGREQRFNRQDVAFLETVRDSLGTQSFARFWTDPAPFDSAFFLATGMAPEEWMHRSMSAPQSATASSIPKWLRLGGSFGVTMQVLLACTLCLGAVLGIAQARRAV